jgi:hypothetical protein
VLITATGNGVIDGMIAIQTGPKSGTFSHRIDGNEREAENP